MSFVFVIIGANSIRMLMSRIAMMIVVFPCASVIMTAAGIGSAAMRKCKRRGKKEQYKSQEKEFLLHKVHPRFIYKHHSNCSTFLLCFPAFAIAVSTKRTIPSIHIEPPPPI